MNLDQRKLLEAVLLLYLEVEKDFLSFQQQNFLLS